MNLINTQSILEKMLMSMKTKRVSPLWLFVPLNILRLPVVLDPTAGKIFNLEQSFTEDSQKG